MAIGIKVFWPFDLLAVVETAVVEILKNWAVNIFQPFEFAIDWLGIGRFFLAICLKIINWGIEVLFNHLFEIIWMGNGRFFNQLFGFHEIGQQRFFAWVFRPFVNWILCIWIRLRNFVVVRFIKSFCRSMKYMH